MGVVKQQIINNNINIGVKVVTQNASATIFVPCGRIIMTYQLSSSYSTTLFRKYGLFTFILFYYFLNNNDIIIL